MKSAFNKELFRAITHSLGRFLAIAIIAALGTGFFAGLRMTSVDMNLAADELYDGTHFSDIHVICSLGLEDEDIESIASIEGVEAACGEHEVDALASLRGIQYVARVHGLDVSKAAKSQANALKNAVESDDASYINRPVLYDGKWPENKNECLICEDCVLESPVQLGDKVVFSNSASDLEDTLKQTSYTVVGLVRSPYYVCNTSYGSTSLGNGSIDFYAYVPEGNFKNDIPYSGAYVTVTGAKDLFSGSADYKDFVAITASRIEEAGEKLVLQRQKAVKDSAQEKLDKRIAEYEKAKADADREFDDAKDELDSAKREIDSAQQELADSWEQLQDAASEIESSEQELKEAQAQIDKNASELAKAEKEYTSGANKLAKQKEAAEAQFAAAQAQIDQMPDEPEEYASAKSAAQAQLDAQIAAAQAQFDSAQKELDAAKAKIDAGKKELEEAQAKVDAGKAKLESGKAEYASGLSRYNDGIDELEDGKAEYEDGVAEYATEKQKAQDKLAKAKKKLDKAQRKIDDIEVPDWYVLDRTKNVGAESYSNDAGRIGKIAQVFPFIFFLVALLVTLTTMTRMVDEERILIGTYKALGYGSSRICSKYLVYALIASGVGSIVGIFALSTFLPAFIMNAYSIVYAVPSAGTPIDIPISALSIGLGVGITLLATLWAVLNTLREKPALLMLPRVPKAGKRILLEHIKPLWNSMSFTWKVTARNIFRYKRRFLMAIIGVAGCTALLLTGLGLRTAINDIIDIQFNDIYHYNMTVQLDPDIDSANLAKAEKLLDNAEYVESHVFTSNENVVSYDSNGAQSRINFVSADDIDALQKFVTMRTRVEQTPITLADDGVVISEKLSSALGIQAGGTIQIYRVDDIGNAMGKPTELTVADVMENYTGLYIFSTSSYYSATMGEDPEFSQVLCYTPCDQKQRAELSDKLLAIENVNVVSYTAEVIDTYRTMLKTMDAVCMILIVAAALLAFVVLYNLTNINITERAREIATLKVLGFTPGEVNAYIYRETMILSVIGAAIGLLLGIWMNSFVVTTAEVDQMMFGRSIHPESFVMAFVLTIVFSIVVTIAMKRKLRNIDMVESLKSIE